MEAEKKIHAVRLMAACREQVMEIVLCAENDDERLAVEAALRGIADELFDCTKADKDRWDKHHKMGFLYWNVFRDDYDERAENETAADECQTDRTDRAAGLYDEEAERAMDEIMAEMPKPANVEEANAKPQWIHVVSSRTGLTTFRCSHCGRVVNHAGKKCPMCWNEMDSKIAEMVEVTV